MKIFTKVILLCIVIGLLPALLYAPPGGSWNPGNTDPTVPLGGGIVFLTIAGLFYSIRSFYRNRKS